MWDTASRFVSERAERERECVCVKKQRLCEHERAESVCERAMCVCVRESRQCVGVCGQSAGVRV